MSRLYDTVEPAVVDEEMLKTAVEEQGPKEEAGRIAKAEGIDFKDVMQLRLDFKNILKVDNMWSFESLVKLQLDNNIIEKVEGLDHLVNLVWLDLSFNNIEVIEGLDKLAKLEDLTLYNNRIERIENMDKLLNLHVLSLGNNGLSELENVGYLRRFKKLRTLNLSGNPFCDDENYRLFVVAHVTVLDYLDYRLVDESTRTAANEKYHLTIEEIKQDEAAAERKAEEAVKAGKELELNTAAFVEHLNGPFLFDSLYAEDTEGQKLKEMPGVDELIIVFQEKFVAICQQIFEYGLSEYEKRDNEVQQFWDCITEAMNENKVKGTSAINTFLDYKKKLFIDLMQMTDQKMIEIQISEYIQKVTELWDMLMGLELLLVDQLEDAVKDFERSLADMVGITIEQVQGFFSQCRDYENIHHEKLLEIAIVTLEKVVKNELEEEISEDLRMLCVDKDTIMNAVSTSHDVHLLKIDNREDDLITRINTWLKNLIEKIHEEQEVKRNRSRVSEINNLIDHLREEIDNLDLPAYQ